MTYKKKLICKTINQIKDLNLILKSKYWVEINDDLYGVYATGSQIKFTTLMLRSSLCDYSGAYILFRRTKTVPNTAAVCADTNARNKIF